eukprot:801337-Prorocentrum_minimum.AAC.5
MSKSRGGRGELHTADAPAASNDTVNSMPVPLSSLPPAGTNNIRVMLHTVYTQHYFARRTYGADKGKSIVVASSRDESVP